MVGSISSNRPGAAGNAYNVTDGERHTYRDVLDRLREMTGKRSRIVPIPGAVFHAGLKVVLGLARRRKSTQASRDHLSESLRVFDLDSIYSIEKARKDLGFTRRVGHAEGLERTLAFSRESLGTS